MPGVGRRAMTGRAEPAVSSALRADGSTGESIPEPLPADHRPVPLTLLDARAAGPDFQVVGGRAGPLGDARHGRGLHSPAVLGRRVDEPARKHASAFASKGRDQNRPGSVGPLRCAFLEAGRGRQARAGNDRRAACCAGRSGGGSVARPGGGLWIRVGHGRACFRRGRARRSPGSAGRAGTGPTGLGCSPPRHGRTTGRARPRARPRRTARIPRSRC